MRTKITVRSHIVVLALGLTSGLLGYEAATGHGKTHNPTRSAFMAESGIPAEYAERLNPLPAAEKHLNAGTALYEENCSICHGAMGDGRGDAAGDLEPPPPALNNMYAQRMAARTQARKDTHLMHGVAHHHPGQTHAEAMGGMNIDAYMFWAIADGGEIFGTAMPAFKDLLSEEERWQILVYVANGLSGKLE